MTTSEYRPIGKISMESCRVKFTLAMVMVGLGSAMLAAGFISYIPHELLPSLIWRLPLIIAGVALVMVLHETLHGLVVASYHFPVKWGVAWSKVAGPVAYITSPGSRFTRTQVIWVLAMPQLITLLSFLGFWLSYQVWGMLAFVTVGMTFANLAGGTADFWSILKVASQPRENMYEDTKEGLLIWYKEVEGGPSGIQG